MSKFEFIPISDALDVGTRIHFDECSNCVYFVDVPNSDVYKYDVHYGQTTKAKVGNEPIAFMFPVEGTNTKFIAGLARKFVLVEWDGVSPNVSNVEVIAEVENDPILKDNRLNGGKVDPWGRLWAGTHGPPDKNGEIIPGRAALYSVEKGVLKKHICNIGISNGLAWDTKKMKMYYIDTLKPQVVQFDFSEDGRISNEKVVFEFGPNNIAGKPDGMSIDKDGNVWITAIFGSTIICFDPTNGSIKNRIDLATPQPTSLAFGGPNYDDIYITTARIPIDGKAPPAPAGTTYVIKKSGIVGLRATRYLS